MPFRKEYLLVSSDDRIITGQSTTTNFVCQLANPIDNVVKTDLVSVSADYRIANITSPNNTFTVTFYNFTTLALQTETITIPESLYNASELLITIVQEMNAMLTNVSAQSTVTGLLLGTVIRLDLDFNNVTTTATERTFTITCTSSILRAILGMTSSTRSGTYTASIGLNGGSRLTMPSGVTLPGLYPYILIQSTALGNDTQTTKGLTFWRAIVNNSSNPVLEIANNRVDEYNSPPRRLYQIDVRLIFPNGEYVDNRGGTFAFICEIIIEVQSFEEKEKHAIEHEEQHIKQELILGKNGHNIKDLEKLKEEDEQIVVI